MDIARSQSQTGGDMPRRIDVENDTAAGESRYEPTQRRAIRTRDEIVAIAARAFDARGYAAASMSAIVSESYLSKGSIYFHFPSKESIARYLVAGWIGAVERSIVEAAGARVSRIEQLRVVCADLTERVGSDVALRSGMKLTIDPALGDGSAFSRWVALAEVLIESAVAAGEVDDTPVVRRLAWNVCAGMVGIACASAVVEGVNDSGCRIADVVNAHIDVVVNNRNGSA